VKPRESQSSSWRLPSQRPLVIGAIIVLAGALAGLGCLIAPLFTWAFIGTILVLVVVLAPAYIRVGVAVLAATFSRLLVFTGFFPEFLNFFHYPLALVAAFVAAAEVSHRSPLARVLERGMLALLAVSLLSWLINGGEILRPFLDWLVFTEPFLIIYAVVAMPPEPRSAKALWRLAMAIPLAQLPLAAYQALTLGLGDRVQGLFIGMGAGAHVAGAVALLGAMICTARAVSALSPKARPIWLLGAALLFLIAVLADAKQVIIGFLPALLLILLSLMRLRWTRVVVVLPALAVLILGAFSYYQPLQVVLDWVLISRGVYGKVQAFFVIAARLSSSVGRWLLGLGPGNSVSRVALMGLEAFVKPGSPVALLGLRSALTTSDILVLTSSNWLFSSSSVWSGVSSWLGLLGDLGLAGLGLYIWMCWRIWHGLKSPVGWQSRVARGVLLMCGLLSVMYSWLEEPGFTLSAALVVGLGLIAEAAPDGTAEGRG
jgi:hypothetical protein